MAINTEYKETTVARANLSIGFVHAFGLSFISLPLNLLSPFPPLLTWFSALCLMGQKADDAGDMDLPDRKRTCAAEAKTSSPKSNDKKKGLRRL